MLLQVRAVLEVPRPSCLTLCLVVPTVSYMDAIEVNGAAIREIRTALRVPIEQLADEIGVTRAYLCKVELGHSKRMSLGKLDALERALGVKDRRALVARPDLVQQVPA